MDDANQLAKAAALMGDPSRATMLWSLMGGESRPASELAMLANVSAQTASNHLRLLLEAGFLEARAMGRNRFYRLSGPRVAAALEALSAAVLKPASGDGAAHRAAPDLVFARTCYDHLAGELAVAILGRLRQMDYLRERAGSYRLTDPGARFLEGLGVDVSGASLKRRRFAYPCLDWSQRRPHLGGALGAAVLDWLFRAKLVARMKAGRAVRLTDAGRKHLGRSFAITPTYAGEW